MYVPKEIQEQMKLNIGGNLYRYTMEHNVLLIFLRHFGCVFCKEAMNDIAELKPQIKAIGVKVIFVHMADNEVADKYFAEYNLADAIHISDPTKKFYQAFGLRKGSFTQLYGLQTWVRGFAPENKNNKLEVSKSLGDATQMPGIFHMAQGKILESYIHTTASDKPNYIELAECCLAI